MLRHIGIVTVAVLVVAILLLWIVAFTVGSTEKVLVKTFGETTRVLEGHNPQQAGLSFKWPYPVQEVVRYDARTFFFEDALTQFQTYDKKLMLATMFCAWRIEDPVKFHRAVVTVSAAEQRLRDLLRDTKEKVLPKYSMSDYANTEADRMKLAEIEQEVYKQIQAQARENYGVEVAMVGIKSLGLPESVTTDVIEAMKNERQKEISTYKASGEAQATAIRERAKGAAEQIREFAKTKAAKIESEGVKATIQYYQQYSQNESLAAFLRTLESTRKALQGQTVIVLDPQAMSSLGYFTTGPPASVAGTPPASSDQKVETPQKNAEK